MFSKVLVPVDGSSYAENAVRYASDLAKGYGSSVTLIHVVATRVYAMAEVGLLIGKDLEKEGKKILKRSEELADSLGISTNTIIVSGVPAEEILRFTESEKFDLIVMGSRGLTEVKAFLLGNVSDKVSHHAKCSVLIVK